MRGPPEPLTAKDLLRRFLAPAIFVALIFSVYFRATDDPTPATEDAAAAAPAERDVVLLEGRTMGTTFSVKVVGELSAEQQRALAAAVQGELDTVNAQMSTWREDSELSRFNQHAATTPFDVSPETRAVVVEAARVWGATGGAFDPTVGPLVRAWGFGGGDAPAAPLDDAAIAELRAHLGLDKVAVDREEGTLTKSDPAVELDLSAIAKGWGVDRVHKAVTALGHEDVMVEIGGEVRVSGRSARGERWRLGIERPDSGRGVVHQVVALEGEAMATSGDYRNYVERDGQRWSHTIDPRTGRPITHGLASVTVIADDCTTADAWATALNVLGPDEGPAVADAQGLKAYFLVRAGDGFEPRLSAALAESDRLAGP
jgi:thiamine biosynthesis lipoprotein